ncbi:type II toxin-antitoxin system RelE/ParE family toxin [Pseudodonghicola xiamenensis]|uniref:Toxin n=1 Tax=Pseudodonghicola xiamenensis TaxID=337702 RepID=A0A8J3MFS0_9RHOB|nr:type II toxin-antitoxin system RelE/ParE family toxin [Pseudodonghicola xiamenensis]GHH05122.1 hypothetical protein GCM10010961_43890 [Pseudodonghicola xiamenensis]
MAGYDLTHAAEEDLRGIWAYTYETWGADQADRYLDQIETCFDTVASGRAQAHQFEQLPSDVRIYRCEHHFIVWLAGPRPIIIAVLHERMEFMRHLKDRL